MTVESLDTCENLAVVSARDQDLCARADGGLEDGEGAGGELMFFDLSNFVLARQQCQYRNCCGLEGVRTSTPNAAWIEALCARLAHIAVNVLAVIHTESLRPPWCRIVQGSRGRFAIWGWDCYRLTFQLSSFCLRILICAAQGSSAQGWSRAKDMHRPGAERLT